MWLWIGVGLGSVLLVIIVVAVAKPKKKRSYADEIMHLARKDPAALEKEFEKQMQELDKNMGR